MGSTQPFRPSGTAVLAAGIGSANVPLVGGGDAVLIYNSSAAVAYVRFGTAPSVAANAADTPIPPGARMLMHLGGPFVTIAAALLAAGSGTVFFTRGDGTVY